MCQMAGGGDEQCVRWQVVEMNNVSDGRPCEGNDVQSLCPLPRES